MSTLHIFDHPLICHKITMMRDKNTTTRDFRELAEEITLLMAYEVTKNVSLREINITTPICDTIGYEVKDNILIVPILRAGLGLVDGFKKVIPTASIGHIGLARDEVTFKPFEYLSVRKLVTACKKIIVCFSKVSGSAYFALACICVGKTPPERKRNCKYTVVPK